MAEILDRETAAAVDCGIFWRGDRGDRNQDWVDHYWLSQQEPHRGRLATELLRFEPSSAYEFGCHCGPNLARLREAGVSRVAGCDVNEWAVARAMAEFPGADIRLGTAPAATRDIASGSFDVVFSCYALAYVSPLVLRQALAELWRMARHALVIFEPMAMNGASPELSRHGEHYFEWRHDYVFFVSSFVGLGRATVQRMALEDSLLNGLLTLERGEPVTG